MDVLLEVFVTKVWAIAVNQANAISRFGRSVIMTAHQIRKLARRGRNRIYTLAQIRTMTNKPIIFIDEPPAPREACKRLHNGEFADAAKQLAYEESIAQGFNDLTVDCSDKVNIMEASNCGNLYGGNGNKGIKMASNNGELYGINNDVAGITSNDDSLYGGNGTTEINEIARNNGTFHGINTNGAVVASYGGRSLAGIGTSKIYEWPRNNGIKNKGTFIPARNLRGRYNTITINKMAINKGRFGFVNYGAVLTDSNDGNLYGGNVTTGNSKMAGDNDELYGIKNDDVLIIVSNGGKVYGENVTTGSSKMASNNDDFMIIDDTISISSASNGN